jgi:hypothetical protein
MEELKYGTTRISTRVVFDMASEFLDVVERDSYEYSGPVAQCASGGVTGTGIQTPPALLLNTLDAIGIKEIYPYLGDLIFYPSPTFWAMQRNGKTFRLGELIWPLITSQIGTQGNYYGDQMLNTALVDAIQPADQPWRFYYQTITLAITDILLNRGGPIDIMMAQMQIGAASMLNMLADAMWGIAPFNSSTDVDSIDAWIGQTTNTIAGVSRTAVTAWAPPGNISAGAAHLTVAVGEQAYQTVTFGYDYPDVLVLNNTDYGNFKIAFTANTTSSPSIIRAFDNFADRDAVQTNLRYQFMFNNCMVIADRYVPTGNGYMFNTKYLFPVFKSDAYFTVRPWIAPSNQDTVSTLIRLGWQVSSNSPRTGCKIINIA